MGEGKKHKIWKSVPGEMSQFEHIAKSLAHFFILHFTKKYNKHDAIIVKLQQTSCSFNNKMLNINQ